MVCVMAGQTIITRMSLIGPTFMVPLLHTIQDRPLAIEDLVSSLVLPLCPSNLLLCDENGLEPIQGVVVRVSNHNYDVAIFEFEFC